MPEYRPCCFGKTDPRYSSRLSQPLPTFPCSSQSPSRCPHRRLRAGPHTAPITLGSGAAPILPGTRAGPIMLRTRAAPIMLRTGATPIASGARIAPALRHLRECLSHNRYFRQFRDQGISEEATREPLAGNTQTTGWGQRNHGEEPRRKCHISAKVSHIRDLPHYDLPHSSGHSVLECIDRPAILRVWRHRHAPPFRAHSAVVDLVIIELDRQPEIGRSQPPDGGQHTI